MSDQVNNQPQADNDDQPIITSLKPLRKPTRKETAFARYLVDNPTSTITEAYRAVYNWNGSHEGAMHEASQTHQKPTVKLELAKYSSQAESVVVEVMNNSNEFSRGGGHVGAAYAGTALAAARDVLDRVHGKATQRVEQHTTAVTLNIDLTDTVTQE